MGCVLLSGVLGSPGAGELLLGNWAPGRAGTVWGISDGAAKEEKKQASLQPCSSLGPSHQPWPSCFPIVGSFTDGELDGSERSARPVIGLLSRLCLPSELCTLPLFDTCFTLLPPASTS